MPKAKILEPTDANIRICAQELNNGRVLAIPTETVYGLAGIATDEAALAKIFSTKERPTFDPLIVHVNLERASLASLMREGLVDPEPLTDLAVKRADLLIRSFWPGPLTLVLPKLTSVPDLATSGLGTVAIRAPAHPVARKLIAAVEMPLCAPSANRFGRISPTSAEDVQTELGERIPYILDGGLCTIGVESTIVQILAKGEVRLLRPGGLARELIEKTLGVSLARPADENGKAGVAQTAPGMLSSHYAPKKRLVILPSRLDQMMAPPKFPFVLPKKIGLLTLRGNAAEQAEIGQEIFDRDTHAESLSATGDWTEAAQNFFRKLRALDDSDADVLLAEPIDLTEGLAFAIADRLKRAAFSV